MSTFDNIKNTLKYDKSLSGQCFVLADIAEPPNMKRAYESSLSVVSFTAQLEGTTGLPLTLRDKRGGVQGISLTGWVALLGIASCVVLSMYGIAQLVRKLRGAPETSGYTLVQKKTRH